MLELRGAEQGPENGDIAQPRELVDGVIARRMNQPGQDDGLPGMHVDDGVGLARQKRRIALDGERGVDLADLGFDVGQNIALTIDVRLGDSIVFSLGTVPATEIDFDGDEPLGGRTRCVMAQKLACFCIL